MDIEIRHLKLVAAVAQEGSITKAGHRLHLTQSALSHQLRDAEERLGVSLFLRLNKKRMVLTQAGEALLRSAHTVLDELARAQQNIRRMGMNREGILRISTQCNTCYYWLPAMLADFHQKFPRIEVQIVAEGTHAPISLLLDGKLDLVVTYVPVRNRRLLFKPLFKDELVLVMPPGHRLAARPFIGAEDFAGEHLLCYSLPMDDNLVFRELLRPAGISPRQISQMGLTEAIIEMLKAGQGVSILARWAVAPQLADGTLIARSITKKGFHRHWYAAMMRNQSTPPYLLEFVKRLANQSLPVVDRRPPPLGQVVGMGNGAGRPAAGPR